MVDGPLLRHARTLLARAAADPTPAADPAPAVRPEKETLR